MKDVVFCVPYAPDFSGKAQTKQGHFIKIFVWD